MTTEIDDGGPAFPTDANTWVHGIKGLSKRDYFAANAPASMVDNIVGDTITEASAFIGIAAHEYDASVHWPMCDAKARYQWADAMLKARGE